MKTYENESSEQNAIGTDYAMYADRARLLGAKTGSYIASFNTLHERDTLTIARAAIAFVNHLPLSDITVELRLKEIFETAAEEALACSKS